MMNSDELRQAQLSLLHYKGVSDGIGKELSGFCREDDPERFDYLMGQQIQAETEVARLEITIKRWLSDG